ncbi:MAG: hypothetical protein K2G71_05765 [Duncaniella sp.]|nr:hypothetical protein [Duncaniella sp.]
MKTLSPKGMKTLKTVHLILIMMWTTGVATMCMLYWKPASSGLDFLYNQKYAMFIDYTLVIPGALLTVVTGIVYGTFTKWGFFKFRWLTVKWIVGILVILIGTFGLHPLAETIIEQASPIANGSVCIPADFFGSKPKIVGYTGILQALALVFLIVISVFKPWTKKN